QIPLSTNHRQNSDPIPRTTPRQLAPCDVAHAAISRSEKMRVAATLALAACLPLAAARLRAQEPEPADPDVTLPPVTVTPSVGGEGAYTSGDFGNYGYNPGYGRS